MKDEHEKIKKQSYISLFFSYCIYFHNIRLMHLLIDEITQLAIITVYTKVLKNRHLKLQRRRADGISKQSLRESDLTPSC